MNFREEVVSNLEHMGIFTRDAKVILERTIESNDQMRDRWHEDTSAYPDMLKGLVIQMAYIDAYHYLMETCPLAWNAMAFHPRVPSDTSKFNEFADKHKALLDIEMAKNDPATLGQRMIEGMKD